jgi:hypothetical protein
LQRAVRSLSICGTAAAADDTADRGSGADDKRSRLSHCRVQFAQQNVGQRRIIRPKGIVDQREEAQCMLGYLSCHDGDQRDGEIGYVTACRKEQMMWRLSER